MPVKIRLARRGRKKLAMYDVIIADSRSPRDGRFIEKIGTYNPNTNPASINIDEEKAFEWVMKGAQPTDTVKAMLSYKGVLIRRHLQIGVGKGAITQEVADAKFAAWKQNKDAKISGKVDTLADNKVKDAKARLDAETKKSADRAAAIAKKNAPVAEPVAEVIADVVAEPVVATVVDAPATEEVTKTEE